MCIAQFTICYGSKHASDAAKKYEQEDADDEDSGDEYLGRSNPPQIISGNLEHEENKLPKSILLAHNLGHMKLRNIPAVLRIHKLQEDDFFYSELLLYWPWRDESKELFQPDINLYG